jgi:hypothetical protein
MIQIPNQLTSDQPRNVRLFSIKPEEESELTKPMDFPALGAAVLTVKAGKSEKGNLGLEAGHEVMNWAAKV